MSGAIASDGAAGTVEALRRGHARALERRRPWEPLWRDCREFALPDQGDGERAATRKAGSERLFDGTAPDAVDQLASGLLAELAPPWGRWFALEPGRELAEAEREALAPALERVADVLARAFARSNLAIELHQCLLDLVTLGTACLAFEEAGPGEASPFRFRAVPLMETAFEEGPTGRLDGVWRTSRLEPGELAARFPDAGPPPATAGGHADGRTDERRVEVVEAVLPDVEGWTYRAFRARPGAAGVEDRPLAEGRFERSPFLAFRWVKAPGEVYGRSPLMKALPDVKTANKVVELVLKNASIAATGIWQADDDGVLNPATVRLVPGTIIPKAVGSGGLKALEPPGRFDVSELVLQDLRARIRRALLVDKLGQVDDPRMTATEVLERSAEMARVLGAAHARIQAELLQPLVERGLSILTRRGLVPPVTVDGRTVDLAYRSPLAESRRRAEARGVAEWLETATALGPDALAVVDRPGLAAWLARAHGVPAELIRGGDPLGEALATVTRMVEDAAP